MMDSKHNTFYYYIVALFLYATMLVDLYRKLVGVNTEVFRNVVYILCFILIFYDAIKKNHITHMLLLGGAMSILYLLSSLINTGHTQVYNTAWFLFISRLLPAYYIGRYTEDWGGVASCIRKYIWIALLYAVVAYSSGLFDSWGGISSYATIGKNLFYVVWIALYDSYLGHKTISFIICLISFIPVMFLGTRACLFGVLAVFLLYFSRVIRRSSTAKKTAYFFLLIVVLVTVGILFNSLISNLHELLPNSRTLDFLTKGHLLDDSNRYDSYYVRYLKILNENPLKVYGLVGNQIYSADMDAPTDVVLSSFAHNVYLELCMNFGFIIGILLGIYFTVVLVKAFINSRYFRRDIEFVYLGVLGMTFVNMLVSFSWLFSYEIWLLFGLAYSIIKRR